MEDIGVRAVVEGVDKFVSDLNRMQGAVTKQSNQLASLTNVYEQNTKAADKMVEVSGYQMRRAMAAVSSAFHVATSGLLFFLATQENMSGATKTIIKIVTGFTLAMAGASAAVRLYTERHIIAIGVSRAWAAAVALQSTVLNYNTVATWANSAAKTVLDAVTKASLPGLYAFAAAVVAATWELVLIAAAIAAVAAAAYLMYREFTKTPKPIKDTKDAIKGLGEEMDHIKSNMKSTQKWVDDLTASLGDLKRQLSALTEQPLEGMQQFDDQIFGTEQSLKKVNLELLQLGDSAEESELGQQLLRQKAELERNLEILRLQRDIKFDPLQKEIQDTADGIQGLTDEWTKEEVLKAITDIGSEWKWTNDQIDALNGDLVTLAANFMAAADEAARLQEELNKMHKPNFWDRLAGLSSSLIGGMWPFGGAQFGGYFPQSQMLRVGERGPEIMMAPAGASVQPNVYNSTYNVNANYSNPQSPQSIALDLEYIRMRSRA